MMLTLDECISGASAAAAAGRQDSEAAAAAVEWEDSTGVSAPLYEVVDVIFDLGSRGFFRRQVPLSYLHMRSGTRWRPPLAALIRPLPPSCSTTPPSAKDRHATFQGVPNLISTCVDCCTGMGSVFAQGAQRPSANTLRGRCRLMRTLPPINHLVLTFF